MTLSEEYNFLNERYAKENTKVCTINGLMMAMAMCQRILIERYSEDILRLMGNISTAIEKIEQDK